MLLLLLVGSTSNASDFILNVSRIQDLGVVVDCLPVLTNRYKQKRVGN